MKDGVGLQHGQNGLLGAGADSLVYHWGGMDDSSVKKLQVNMANIRKKLGCRPGDNRYVINELGVGYRMADE